MVDGNYAIILDQGLTAEAVLLSVRKERLGQVPPGDEIAAHCVSPVPSITTSRYELVEQVVERSVRI